MINNIETKRIKSLVSQYVTICDRLQEIKSKRNHTNERLELQRKLKPLEEKVSTLCNSEDDDILSLLHPITYLPAD